MNSTKNKLQFQLDAQKSTWASKASESTKILYREAFEQIEKGGIIEKAIKSGDKAPDFILENTFGKKVQLSKLLLENIVILTWYRGGWCPYCNLTLRALQQAVPEFEAAGAKLVALTPELPDNSLSTVEKLNLEFEVLSDIGNQVAKQYKVVFRLHPEVAKIYQDSFGLHDHNGDESEELPLAATYIIDQSQKVRYAFLNVDYRFRADPQDLLAELNRIKT